MLLTTQFLLTKWSLPRCRGWGRVINISSVHGLLASPFKAGYVAATHGLVGLTKVVALEATARLGLCGPSAWTQTGSVLTLDAGWLAH